MNPRRLYRCRRDRQLAGVAAGMAEYFDLDPTVVRILWILSAFVGGFTILLYIILAFVVPLEPATAPGPGSWHGAGPAWGVPPTPGAGTEQAGEVPGSAQDPGAGSPPDSGTSNVEWHAPVPDQRPDSRRGGRGGLYVGVLLVVFGAIAMADTLIPGWAGVSLMGPALLIALGTVLLAGSIRRGAYER
jgi:phage shock protein C